MKSGGPRKSRRLRGPTGPGGPQVGVQGCTAVTSSQANVYAGLVKGQPSQSRHVRGTKPSQNSDSRLRGQWFRSSDPSFDPVVAWGLQS